MNKYVVYEVEIGFENERWRGMELARVSSMEEAEAFIDQDWRWCEIEVEE